ncbi:Uncharacterized protein C14orf80, partial [Eschrichtius robustus]|nr:Uncharacterized protein C14orf80 [Eschrichtius robustus]
MGPSAQAPGQGPTAWLRGESDRCPVPPQHLRVQGLRVGEEAPELTPEPCPPTLSLWHEGKPYCNHPCYAAMFGPKGFGREAQVRSVKLALRTQGYPRRALAQLPDDGSQGGRELLLALAWLLAREPLPERLLAQNRVQLGDEMHVCECEALASPGPPAPSVEADGCVDIRHLQWLMGKLRFRWRNLMASQQEQCALLGKIHSYTRGCHSDRSLGHLSVTETELLRDPEGGRQVRAGGTKVGVAQGLGLLGAARPTPPAMPR